MPEEIVYNIVTYSAKNHKYSRHPMVGKSEDLNHNKIEALAANFEVKGERLEFISVEGSNNGGFTGDDIKKLLGQSRYLMVEE